MTSTEDVRAPDFVSDHYRCPQCDLSTLRGDPSPAQRPGIYREGYMGPWFACPDHGIVQAKYYSHRPGESSSYDEYRYSIRLDEAEELLERVEQLVDPTMQAAIHLFLAPVREEKMERHCFHGPSPVVGERGLCSTCGRYWQRIQGVWFSGGRTATGPGDASTEGGSDAPRQAR